jgi:hypothetical protein
MSASRPSSERTANAANMASPYVALDSWVYPDFDRLAALGAVQTAFAGLRPWTRMDWIGCEGDGVQPWSTWWISPRASVQSSYRRVSVHPTFFRGGDLHDLSVSSDLPIRCERSVHLAGQYERWRFPLLFPHTSGNITASAQLTWSPGEERR